jgi:hypothetical protein
MARLKLEISEERYLQLLEIAVSERRPAHWQAEVILEQAIARYVVPQVRLESAGTDPEKKTSV